MKTLHNPSVPQELMKREAQAQCRDRSEREGVPCYVFSNGETWYVRTDAEGKPDGAELVWCWPLEPNQRAIAPGG